MADTIRPDLCILGGTALGIDLAIAARGRGLDVVLVKLPSDAGGDAPGERLRRAAVRASAGRAQAIRTASRVGLENGEPKVSFRLVAEHAQAMANGVAHHSAPHRLVALGITVLDGAARFTDPQTLHSGDTVIRARQFALATGSRPVVPALPGLDQVAYFTPDTIGDNLRKLSHLVVVGGSAGALDLAQSYRRLGSAVTLVPQGELLGGFDPELVALLLRGLREEGVVVLEGAKVAAIVPRSQGTGVTLEGPEGLGSLDVSHILVAMGGKAVLPSDLLEQARLRRDADDADALAVSANGQTSSRRITALGGAAGEDQGQVATLQGRLLIERLLGRGNGRLHPGLVPRVLMTDPPLAQAGTLAPLPSAKGARVFRSNASENHAARALGQASGEAKVVVDADGTLMGAGVVGPGAGEIVAMITLAMQRGLKLGDLATLAVPEPSTAALLADLADQYLANNKPTRRIGFLPKLGR